MFGISYVELILVLGIGSVVLGDNSWLTQTVPTAHTGRFEHLWFAAGPKDLPRVARAAGQATGRAAAYLTAARTKFASFAKETELDKVRTA